MQVYYDLVLGLFLESPTSRVEITQITFKRASNNPFSIQFLNNGTPTTLPTGTTFIFMGKLANQYDDSSAIYVDNTGWSGPDANGFYNCNPTCNTVPLNTAFGYTYPTPDTLPHPDFVLLDGEVSWLKPGDTIKNATPYWTLKCYNDVSKGIEGIPTSGGPVYPAPAAIELIANKGQPGGYAPLGTDGKVPLIFLPTSTGATPYVVKTSTYNFTAGDKIAADTTTAAFTGTLPASPSVGDLAIEVIDPQGTHGTHNFTINPGSNLINGVTGTVALNMSGNHWLIDWVGGATGWRII